MELTIEIIQQWGKDAEKKFSEEELFSAAEFIFHLPRKPEHLDMLRSELVNIYLEIYRKTLQASGIEKDTLELSIIFDFEEKVNFFKGLLNNIVSDFRQSDIINGIIRSLINGNCTKENCPIDRKIIRDHLLYQCKNIEFLQSAIQFHKGRGLFEADKPANELARLLEPSLGRSRFLPGVSSFAERIKHRLACFSNSFPIEKPSNENPFTHS